jgi:hypothetical protein
VAPRGRQAEFNNIRQLYEAHLDAWESLRRELAERGKPAAAHCAFRGGEFAQCSLQRFLLFMVRPHPFRLSATERQMAATGGTSPSNPEMPFTSNTDRSRATRMAAALQRPTKAQNVACAARSARRAHRSATKGLSIPFAVDRASVCARIASTSRLRMTHLRLVDLSNRAHSKLLQWHSSSA